MNYTQLFDCLHPGFFEQDGIRALPEEAVFTELALELRGENPETASVPCPDGITFGEYHGPLEALRDAVRQVDENWVKYFREGERFFCAEENGRIVSFCILDDMGSFQGLHIGGPGCVGTLPECRGRGIGLELVRQATQTLRQDGFDLSWIHYTHLERWYMKLGYRPVLRWNCSGVLP